MKIAVEFQVEIFEDGKATYPGGGSLVSDEYWMHDSLDFEYDIYESFIQNWDGLKDVKAGEMYHVFQYGTVHAETSYTEYGPEFDGWFFDVDVEEITKMEMPK